MENVSNANSPIVKPALLMVPVKPATQAFISRPKKLVWLAQISHLLVAVLEPQAALLDTS